MKKPTMIGWAHHPPDSSISEESFRGEYDALYDKVEMVLSKVGENNAYGEGDFYLEPAMAESRGLGLEVTHAAIITEELLSDLQRLLREGSPDWELYLGSGQYDFGIFIGIEDIRIYRRNPDVLSQLNGVIQHHSSSVS